jgi:hypothetical protein
MGGVFDANTNDEEEALLEETESAGPPSSFFALKERE